MKRIIEWIDRISYYGALLSGLLTLLLVFIITYGVVVRYVFNAPQSWPMEVSTYVFCAITIFATAYCLQRDGHVRVDVIRLYYPQKLKSILDMLTFPLIVLLGYILCWFSAQEAYLAYAKGKTSSTALGLPLWPVWLAIFLGSALFFIQTLAMYYHFFKDLGYR